MASWAMRLRELTARYGKVAVGVHFSVSILSTTTLFVAIKNNVDVVPMMERLGLVQKSEEQQQQQQDQLLKQKKQQKKQDEGIVDAAVPVWVEEWKEDDEGYDVAQAQAAEEQASSAAKRAMGTGGALGLALLCNKALLPVRVPITVILTPPVARILARTKLHKNM